MRKTRLIFALIAAVCFAQGCAHSPSKSQALHGAWQTTAPNGVHAELMIREDNSFHVDLTQKQGIEVEGILETEGNTVTFINKKGTDAVSSDTRAGTYQWSIDGNQLIFKKIDDPLNRRARMLALPWQPR